LRQYRTGKTFSQVNKKGKFQMATAKKAAPKAAASPKKVSAPAKVVKPAVKAPTKKAPLSKAAKAIAKISASIAKLTERKDKLNTEINTLRAQRAALKVVPAAAPKAAVTAVAPKFRRKKQS
jgi:hypothetical protein